MTKKVVLKVIVHDQKEKRKAMKAVASILGIDSLAMDMNEKKLTVVGAVDPVEVVGKLKKSCHTELLTVGPAREPEKKKEEPKKDGAKKERGQIDELSKLNHYHHHTHYPSYSQGYYVNSAEENPNYCVMF